ncbi:MAG: hypothetical protein Crog4KO_22180 [Crocinitomicaceae bacterium]
MKIFTGTPSNYMTHLQKSLSADITWTNQVSEKQGCDAVLYVATPDLSGVGHIIDVVNDSNHWKEKTLFYSVMNEKPIPFSEEFTPHQIKSLVATGRMVRVNGGQWFETEKELKEFLTNMRNSNV